MEKIDLKKILKECYQPAAKLISLVDIPVLNYLMIDGFGDPNISEKYKESIEALFAVAYALKFIVKKGVRAIDYVVMPLEGLWWADPVEEFSLNRKSNWQWTMMIMQPDIVDAADFQAAIEQVREKKNLPLLDNLRFAVLQEGLSAQILYHGLYCDEAPVIASMHSFIAANGYRLNGKHHEIYLSDPRKVAPEKLKTILRQPVIKSSAFKS